MRHGTLRSLLPSAFAPYRYRLQSFSSWTWTTPFKGLFGFVERRWRLQSPSLVNRPRILGETAWVALLFNQSRTDTHISMSEICALLIVGTGRVCRPKPPSCKAASNVCIRASDYRIEKVLASGNTEKFRAA